MKWLLLFDVRDRSKHMMNIYLKTHNYNSKLRFQTAQSLLNLINIFIYFFLSPFFLGGCMTETGRKVTFHGILNSFIKTLSWVKSLRNSFLFVVLYSLSLRMDLTKRNNWTLRCHFFDFVGNTVTKEKKGKQNKTEKRKRCLVTDRMVSQVLPHIYILIHDFMWYR